MSWPDGERYSCPLQSLVVSFHLYPLVFFLGVEATASSKFFDPSVFTEQLVLSHPARPVLSRLRFKGHSLLLHSNLSKLAESKILLAEPTVSAPRAIWRLSVNLSPLVQALGSCPASGALWSSAMPPSHKRGRVTTTTT